MHCSAAYLGGLEFRVWTSAVHLGDDGCNMRISRNAGSAPAYIYTNIHADKRADVRTHLHADTHADTHVHTLAETHADTGANIHADTRGHICRQT